MNYYNEFDPFAAAWLQKLIDEGLVPPGYVDTRSIAEVQPDDVRGFTQCHFFAGIGGWSYALQLAGWPEDKPVWTGSCPCQPFSTAGKRQGVNDERHLWPEFAHLIEQCQPPTVLGEQVASKDGRLWLAGVRADLEGMGYAVGAADLCAAGIGAPHIRQRLYWGGTKVGVADATGTRCPDTGASTGDNIHRKNPYAHRTDCECQPTPSSAKGSRMADAADLRREQRREAPATEVQGERTERAGEYPEPRDARELAGRSEGLRSTGRLGNTEQPGLEGQSGDEFSVHQPGRLYPESSGPPPPTGVWADSEWIWCTDGKWRRVAPGIPLLAHGIPNRVGRLRGFGNAIVPPLAAEFVQAYEEAVRELQPIGT